MLFFHFLENLVNVFDEFGSKFDLIFVAFYYTIIKIQTDLNHIKHDVNFFDENIIIIGKK